VNARLGLVLDANILIRAVFGNRVREILERFEDEINFCSPDVCFDDARRYVPQICKKRRIDSSVPLSILKGVGKLVLPVDRSLYEDLKHEARERIRRRDPDDWPVVAVALLLGFPIWTEDPDFFGTGVATWTTATIELYLRTAN
jgi:predicted nucleic acid-binding protein